MKRADLIRHLEKCDCVFVREGGNHTIYKNARTGKMTSIPRHREIKQFLTKKSAMIWKFSVRKHRCGNSNFYTIGVGASEIQRLVIAKMFLKT